MKLLDYSGDELICIHKAELFVDAILQVCKDYMAEVDIRSYDGSVEPEVILSGEWGLNGEWMYCKFHLPTWIDFRYSEDWQK